MPQHTGVRRVAYVSGRSLTRCPVCPCRGSEHESADGRPGAGPGGVRRTPRPHPGLPRLRAHRRRHPVQADALQHAQLDPVAAEVVCHGGAVAARLEAASRAADGCWEAGRRLRHAPALLHPNHVPRPNCDDPDFSVVAADRDTVAA